MEKSLQDELRKNASDCYGCGGNQWPIGCEICVLRDQRDRCLAALEVALDGLAMNREVRERRVRAILRGEGDPG